MSEKIQEQLKAEGYYVSTTVGVSMWPMLRNRRDRVIIRPVESGRLSRYDLPLYQRPDGKFVLHRIIGVKEDHYVIRGDNTYVKEHVPDAWIVGVMSEFYRGKRHITAESRRYRAYAAVWTWLFPIRYVVRGGLLLSRRAFRKLFPKKKA